MQKNTLSYMHAPPLGSLEAYISWAHRVPTLSVEEEQALAVRLRETNDVQAARQLVLAHLRFVVNIARGYQGYGLPQADLIQEGNIGLMKAVKRFDPSVGVRLVSFAVYWIKSEIQEFVIKNWRIVKVATTKAQRKLFFNLRSSFNQLKSFTLDEIQSIAEYLQVSERDVRTMEQRLRGYDESFDPPEDEGSSDLSDALPPSAPSLYLKSPNNCPAQQAEECDQKSLMYNKLNAALAKLDKRSRDIVAARWLSGEKKATLHDLAKTYRVSAERIRQLEQKAINALRNYLNIDLDNILCALNSNSD